MVFVLLRVVVIFFSQIQIFTCRLKNMRFVGKSLEPWQEKEAALKREREEAVKRAENDMTDLERFGVCFR